MVVIACIILWILNELDAPLAVHILFALWCVWEAIRDDLQKIVMEWRQ